MTNVRTLRSIIPLPVLFVTMACHVQEKNTSSDNPISHTASAQQKKIAVSDMDDYEYAIWINRADLSITSIPSDNRRPVDQ